MTASELYHSSVANEESIKQNLYKFIQTHCLSSKSVRVFDPIKGQFVQRDVNCGQCPVCKDLYKNMWYSRMYLHSLDYEYIYFVTLTYAPFDSGSVPDYVSKAAKMELSGTIATFDSYNSSHRLCLSPCVLYKPHLQNFVKRLRRQTGSDLSFYGCGEYGKNWSRPHYHLIIWSHQPLNRAQCLRAWSKCYYVADDGNVFPYTSQKKYVKKRFMFKYGNVDFHDLLRNGTLAKTSVGGDLSGKNAFQYVCKYLCKFNFPEQRVKFAWERYSCFDADFTKAILLDDKDKLDSLNIFYTQNEIELFKQFSASNCFKDYQSFRKAFAPFSLCSRNPAIGFKYFHDNVDRFCQGQFDLCKDLQGKSLVFPSYFLRKCKEFLYSLRHERTNKVYPTLPKFGADYDKSLFEPHFSRSLSLGNIPAFCNFWKKASAIANECPDIQDDSLFTQFIYEQCQDVCAPFAGFEDNFRLYDVRERTRLRIAWSKGGFDLEQYSRHDREFRIVGFLSFDAFCKKYFDEQLCSFLKFYLPIKERGEKDLQLLSDYLSKISKMGIDDNLYFDLQKKYNDIRNNNQKTYDLTHENDL